MSVEQATIDLLAQAMEEEDDRIPINSKAQIVLEDMNLEAPTTTYKIKNFELIKQNEKTKNPALHCFCGKPVVLRNNGRYECGLYHPDYIKQNSSVCGLKIDSSAINNYLIKAGFVKQNDKKLYLVSFPQCPKCNHCILTMFSNKAYANLYGQLVFSCNCSYKNGERMNLKALPNFSKSFDSAMYDVILDSLNPDLAKKEESKAKKIKGSSVGAELEPQVMTVHE